MWNTFVSKGTFKISLKKETKLICKLDIKTYRTYPMPRRTLWAVILLQRHRYWRKTPAPRRAYGLKGLSLKKHTSIGGLKKNNRFWLVCPSILVTPAKAKLIPKTNLYLWCGIYQWQEPCIPMVIIEEISKIHLDWGKNIFSSSRKKINHIESRLICHVVSGRCAIATVVTTKNRVSR